MTHHHPGLEQSVQHLPSWPGDLAGRIASRICHDLVSPVGAIGNGIELWTLTGGAEEASLVTSAAASAAARLRLYRIAFGDAPDGREIEAGDVGAALRDPARGSRCAVTWAAAGPVPRAEGQLIALLALCLECAVPMGGSLEIGGTRPWRLAVTGDLRMADLPLERLADPGGPPLPNARLQFELAGHLARRLEHEIRVERADDRLVLRIS